MSVSNEALEAALTAWDKIETRAMRGRMREALEAVTPYMVEAERVRAAIRLLYPDEMTPTAKRILERILEEAK